MFMEYPYFIGKSWRPSSWVAATNIEQINGFMQNLMYLPVRSQMKGRAILPKIRGSCAETLHSCGNQDCPVRLSVFEYLHQFMGDRT